MNQRPPVNEKSDPRAGTRAEILATRAEPRAQPPVSEIRYEVAGGGNPPVVLVHGFGANAHFWRKWSPTLALRHRVFTVDLAGAGRSPAPAGADYSPQAQAQRVAQLVREIGSPPPVLVGHSLGAGIVCLAALHLADDDPPRPLGGLVLVSGAVYAQRLPPFLTLARLRGLGNLFLLAPPPRLLLRAGLRGIVRKEDCVDAELVEGYREPFRNRGHRRAMVSAARQIDLAGAAILAARIPELDVPTLLIWGEEDPVVPLDQGIRLSRELPDASLVVLPGVGHLPPEEDPAGSLTPVLTFLSSLSGPSSGSSAAAP